MYNFLPVFLGFLHKLDLISEDAYKRFSSKLKDKIFSANSDLTIQMLDEVFTEVEKELDVKGLTAKIEPWLAHVDLLEARVTEVEKLLKASLVQGSDTLKDLSKRVTKLEAPKKPTVAKTK